MHIFLAIAADIIYVDIQNMGVLFNLAAGDADKSIPIFLIQQVAHLLRAAGVKALTDDQK